MTQPFSPPSASLAPVIWIAGLGQLIGHGTIFYSFALVAPGPSAEFGVALPVLFGILSVATLVAGLLGPSIGRRIDRIGGPTVMTVGSLLCGAVLAMLALAPNIWVFAILVVMLQSAAGAALYPASVAMVTQFGGPGVQRAIVLMSLIMGLSSTTFWPFIGWLMPTVGWRWTYAVFAALNIGVAMPCHLWLRGKLLRHRAATLPQAGAPRPAADPNDTGSILPAERRFAFWAVTIFTILTSFISLSLAVHLVPLLMAIGLGTGAFLVAMLMGPAQVTVRLAQTMLFRSMHPLAMGAIMAVCLPLSLVVLVSGLPAPLAGTTFSLLYGIAQGFTAIVMGTLPLVLFGRKGYGELLGRITMFRAIFTAPAPFVLSALWESLGLNAAMLILAAAGTFALVPLAMLRHRMRRPAAGISVDQGAANAQHQPMPGPKV